MRISPLILFGVMVTSSAHAEGDWRSECKSISSLAETIMESRQSGVSMADWVEAADGQEFVESLVIAAFERPGYSTERNQRKSAEEFRDEVYLKCVKARRSP